LGSIWEASDGCPDAALASPCPSIFLVQFAVSKLLDRLDVVVGNEGGFFSFHDFEM
jgi:hypothetical protein